MPGRTDDLRATAAECAALAARAGDPAIRAEFLALAARFRELAESIEGRGARAAAAARAKAREAAALMRQSGVKPPKR